MSAVTIARTLSSPRAEHSYLLRVIVVAAGVRRFMVQDLRSGERREFDNEIELRRFLGRTRSQQLR